ncbi:hypothetical protein BFV95_3849 [Alteromonas macleodii]|uniref:Uncharacterized protein n=1 Tax=Alteromonas macleodii TaxID=28108 RepID=A0AB36FMP2_ALTMA|nr:hypothetical protein BFV95_3849 [Alteromonas macleodii]
MLANKKPLHERLLKFLNKVPKQEFQQASTTERTLVSIHYQ